MKSRAPRRPAIITRLHSAARKEPDRPGARLLGVIVTGEKSSYYIRMVGPDKTMKKLKDDFDEMVKTIKLEED